MYRKAMYLFPSHPGLKHKGSASDVVTNQFLVLHEPQAGLDRFVVGGWIFLRVKQQIVNGGFLETPKNVQQAKFSRCRDRDFGP
jgi:hypothetical protein